VSDALVKRVCTALHSTSGLTFARNEQNKWFVQAILRDCQVGSAVSDTNTDTVGNHECHRCKGTGTVPSSRDNGTCYRCKGKGYTTVIDRNRNAKYAAHRKARVNAMRNGNAQA
jgi:DnaJ-class molecular chaperone